MYSKNCEISLLKKHLYFKIFFYLIYSCDGKAADLESSLLQDMNEN